MERKQRVLVTILWALTGLLVLSMAGAGFLMRGNSAASLATEPPDALPVYYNAPAFSLTDQDGQTVADGNLRGNVWVALLFFTECPGVCPMMTARVGQVQKAAALPDLQIVSFSIDPEHDTPHAMKAFASRFDIDQSHWHFLTGPKETMYQIAGDLKLAAAPAEAGQPITHSTKVLLIDRENRVRGVYDTSDQDSMNKLVEHAKVLAAEKGGQR